MWNRFSRRGSLIFLQADVCLEVVVLIKGVAVEAAVDSREVFAQLSRFHVLF